MKAAKTSVLLADMPALKKMITELEEATLELGEFPWKTLYT